ncbi:Eukaryotic translation initiation factor 3 subunit M [Aphelenchoides besseyi]|nr:Eukaryotic translation initiation factor 3 subunit M [Aphelenchoides besseyi]
MAAVKTDGFFASKEEKTSVAELHDFFTSKEVKLAAPSKDLFSSIKQFLQATEKVAEQLNEKDLELVLNAILNLSIVLTVEQTVEFVKQICEIFATEPFQTKGWNSNAGVAIRVLSNMLHLYAERPQIGLLILKRILEIAGKAEVTQMVDTSLEAVEKYATDWKLTVEDKRELLRVLHHALIVDNRADSAFEVMTTLLKTYTDVDADRAKEDARECVRTAIVDPKSFSVDALLRLTAVQRLQQTDPKIHQVLTLFSTGQLADYRQFIKANPNFVRDQLQVDEEILEKKIKMLSLISLAETQSVISLKKLSTELDIPDIELLEEFLIDAIRINAVNGKINERSSEFVITTFQHRSFARPQWELLQKRLSSLLKNVKRSHGNLDKLLTGEPIEA